MKYTIKGSIGKQELLEGFAQILNSLEDAGVNEFRGVNIYFNTCVSGVTVFPLRFHLEEGRRLPQIRMY